MPSCAKTMTTGVVAVCNRSRSVTAKVLPSADRAMLAMKVPSVFNEVWGAQEVPVRVYVKTALEDVVLRNAKPVDLQKFDA